MFVKYMYVDRWENGVEAGRAIAEPSWEQVMESIAGLDGVEKTIVLLLEKEGSDHHMGICGKWDNCFTVYATKDNSDFFSLIDGSHSIGKRILYVRGEELEYEENKCVPLQWVVDAAKTFFETGELRQDLSWKNGC